MPNEKPLTKTDLDQALSATTEEFKKTFATKDELTQALSATTEEFKNIFATKSDLDQALAATKDDVEQLLADQATVILEAVDERLDKRFGEMMIGIDKVLKEVQAHREEDIAGAGQLRRHDDQLQDHARRIKALETSHA